jgi:hypothetical protein
MNPYLEQPAFWSSFHTRLLVAIVNGVCERAGYNQRIDYRQPVPAPPLEEAEQRWVDELLAPIRCVDESMSR